MTKDELFDYFIYEFIFYYFFKMTSTRKEYDSFSKFSKLLYFGNFIIFQIKKKRISWILQFHYKNENINS